MRCRALFGDASIQTTGIAEENLKTLPSSSATLEGILTTIPAT